MLIRFYAITCAAPRYVKVPNPLVAMDAWRGLACYPRSSFYPLSFRRLLNGRSDHYVLVSHLRGMSALQLSRLVPLHYLPRFHCGIADLNKPLRYFLGEFRPKQTAHQTLSPDLCVGVRNENIKERYFTDGSGPTEIGPSKPPAYATHQRAHPNIKLQ